METDLGCIFTGVEQYWWVDGQVFPLVWTSAAYERLWSLIVLRTVLAEKRFSPGSQDSPVRGLVELSWSLPGPSTLEVVLTLPPTSVPEAGSLYCWPETDQRFQEGLWPGSSREFAPYLMGCLAGLGAWWALLMTSVHLASRAAPFSRILHLFELISLLLALTGFCSGAAHPLSPSSTGHTRGQEARQLMAAL